MHDFNQGRQHVGHPSSHSGGELGLRQGQNLTERGSNHRQIVHPLKASKVLEPHVKEGLGEARLQALHDLERHGRIVVERLGCDFEQQHLEAVCVDFGGVALHQNADQWLHEWVNLAAEVQKDRLEQLAGLALGNLPKVCIGKHRVAHVQQCLDVVGVGQKHVLAKAHIVVQHGHHLAEEISSLRLEGLVDDGEEGPHLGADFLCSKCDEGHNVEGILKEVNVVVSKNSIDTRQHGLLQRPKELWLFEEHAEKGLDGTEDTHGCHGLVSLFIVRGVIVHHLEECLRQLCANHCSLVAQLIPECGDEVLKHVGEVIILGLIGQRDHLADQWCKVWLYDVPCRRLCQCVLDANGRHYLHGQVPTVQALNKLGHDWLENLVAGVFNAAEVLQHPACTCTQERVGAVELGHNVAHEHGLEHGLEVLLLVDGVSQQANHVQDAVLVVGIALFGCLLVVGREHPVAETQHWHEGLLPLVDHLEQ
eukprot:comp24295_c0_seq1/m.45546 comp24295_c0_seq1/g.45546  ORF comp24295_c0_seq1/g.45546 comp24295_c0_seq1/m.45546 type:complete len:478 (+) comp24295_c0_seq1:489-1922(+)